MTVDCVYPLKPREARLAVRSKILLAFRPAAVDAISPIAIETHRTSTGCWSDDYGWLLGFDFSDRHGEAGWNGAFLIYGAADYDNLEYDIHQFRRHEHHIALDRPRLISSSRRQEQGQQSKNDDGSTHGVAPPEYPYYSSNLGGFC